MYTTLSHGFYIYTTVCFDCLLAKGVIFSTISLTALFIRTSTCHYHKNPMQACIHSYIILNSLDDGIDFRPMGKHTLHHHGISCCTKCTLYVLYKVHVDTMNINSSLTQI